MRHKAPIIILLVVLFILITILTTWLNKSQKKNRHYDRKGVLLYLLIGLLVSALLGLLGLGDLSQIQDLFLIFQGLLISMGIAHVLLIFNLFDWTDRSSFLGETLLTVLMGCVVTLAGLGCFWLVDAKLNPDSEGDVMALAQAFMWFPIPYLVARTYDWIMQIPPKIFRAWRYPSYATPEFPVDPFQWVTVNLRRKGTGRSESDISVRSRLPQHVRIGDFFHRFVSKYNSENPQAPIEHLDKDEKGNPIGWVFASRASSRGASRELDPEQMAVNQEIQEGDLIFAQRVLLDPETAEPSPQNYEQRKDDVIVIDGEGWNAQEKGRGEDDSEISFTEK